MSELNMKVMEGVLFMTTDEKGRFHVYKSDPFKAKDPAAEEIDSIEDKVNDFVGKAGDICNPVVLRISAGIVRRSEPFTIEKAEAILSGADKRRSIRDMDGQAVEILRRRNDDAAFPLNGALCDTKGYPKECRQYGADGTCKDGEPKHTLRFFLDEKSKA